MLQTILVTFREGLESFLIVGIIVAYLRKTGRPALIRGVQIGLALSAFTCTIGAYLWMKVPNQPLYEGIGALVAASLVGLLLWQMLRTGRRLKGEIEERVDRAARDPKRSSARGIAAVAFVTTLLVTREGIEAVFFIGVQAFAAKATTVAISAAIGLLGAALFAWIWTRYSHRLNIGVVLRVTSIFLAVFLVQLLVYGVHELAESGVIHGSQGFHDATERFGPDGDIGMWLGFSPALAPLLYLILSRRSRKGGGGSAKIAGAHQAA